MSEERRFHGECKKYENINLSSLNRFKSLYTPIDEFPVGTSRQISYLLKSKAIFQYFSNGDLARSPRIMGDRLNTNLGEKELKKLGIELKLRE